MLNEEPIDHLLDTLISITNQLIQSSKIALSCTISSRKSLLSTYSTLESIIDQSIQTRQNQLKLKVESIQHHHPIDDPSNSNLTWFAPNYRLDRSFLKSFLDQNSKINLIQNGKPSSVSNKTLSCFSSNKSYNPLKLDSLLPSPQLNSQFNPLTFKLDPIETQPNQNDIRFDCSYHLNSTSIPDSTHDSIRPNRSIRSSSSNSLLSPIQIETKSTSSLALSSPRLRIPPGTLTHPPLTKTPEPTALIHSQSLPSSSSLDQKLTEINTNLNHHKQLLLACDQSNSPKCKKKKRSRILSYNNHLLPPFIHHHESFPGSDCPNLLNQVDLNFKLIHASLNTP